MKGRLYETVNLIVPFHHHLLVFYCLESKSDDLGLEEGHAQMFPPWLILEADPCFNLFLFLGCHWPVELWNCCHFGLIPFSYVAVCTCCMDVWDGGGGCGSSWH